MIAVFVSAVFHLHLHKLALEPGHPQEWILVLSLAAIWIVVGHGSYKWLFAAILVGMIGMTKINCGFIFAIPLIVQSLYANNRRSLVQAPVVQVVGGGAISALAITSLSMAMGISIDQLMWGLIGQHRQFTGTFSTWYRCPRSPSCLAFCVYGWVTSRCSLNDGNYHERTSLDWGRESSSRVVCVDCFRKYCSGCGRLVDTVDSWA